MAAFMALSMSEFETGVANCLAFETGLQVAALVSTNRFALRAVKLVHCCKKDGVELLPRY